MQKLSAVVTTGLTVAIAAGVLLCVPSAYGQVVSGSIVGTISDSSGAVIPGATVTITNEGTAVNRIVETNGSGSYSVPDLPPGTYRISAAKQGFATGVQTDIALDVAATARVNVTLKPGQVTQVVTVSAEAAAQLQTDTAQTGRTLAAEVAVLPLTQGHNFQNLLNLVPGTEVAIRQHSTFYNAQNAMSSPTNGMPSYSNMFNIEGVNDNQRSSELAAYIPAMEAIQEVSINTSNYDPSQGSALGSVVNVMIKSGSNRFHGEAYEFYTGNALDARSYFQQGANGAPFKFPHAVDNYFGGNLGGPIQKNKTFFFVDYYRHPTFTGNFYTFSVPTAAMRQGDFSDPALPKIYDPTTGDTADCLTGGNAKLCGTGRTQFPGNIITHPNTVAENLLSHVLLPNNNQNAAGLLKYQNNLLISSVFQQTTSDLDIKIDRYQSERDHISGRFSYQNPTSVQNGLYGDYGGPISISGTAGVEGTGKQPNYSSGVNWVHVFSPNLLSEARVGVNRFHNVAFGAGYGKDLSTAAGIPGANVSPFTSGLTAIQGEGFSDPMVGIFSSFPWNHAQTMMEAMDNVSLIRGNHTFEFGLEYFRVRDDYLTVPWPMGEYGFAAGPTSLNGGTAGNFANQFASFLVDAPSSLTRGYATQFPTFRQNQIFTYIGDKWQFSRKLTVNLGVRWEYYQPATPAFPGGMSNYVPAINSLELAGIGSVPRNMGLASDFHNWDPRMGLAYRLTPQSVVRAGFGISSATFPIDNYAYNYPIEPSEAFSSLSSYGPALLTGTNAATFEQGFPPITPFTAPSSGILPVTTSLLQNQTYYSVPLNWKNPYVMAWNFAYQRFLPGNWMMDIAYVGNRGVHSPVIYNENAATSYGSGAAGQPEYAPDGRTAATNEYFAGFRSAYDGLQLKLDHHFAKNYTVTTSYTYGKAIGYAAEGSDYVGGIQDYVTLKNNWAPTDFNQTQILNVSFVWNLPFGKGMQFANSGVAGKVFGGWEFATDVAFHTGFFMNLSCSCPAFNTPASHAYPNISGPFTKLKGIQTQPWFSTSDFSVPAAGTQGNVGPYTWAGPNFFNMDASLFRKIKLTEQLHLELRSEWFHATNTPQFSNPGTTLGSASFGLVSGAGGARAVDFVGKLVF